MQSRASFFNHAIYRKNLTRFAPLWMAYLAFWIVLMPLSILSQSGYDYFKLRDLEDLILSMGLHGGILINMAYAILIAMAMFSWQYQSRSVNTLGALPIRREAHFLTNVCSALTFSVVPNLIVMALTWLTSAMVGYASMGVLLQWLGMVTLEFLFCFGLASLCAAIVGQILALPVLYMLMNFTAIVINWVSVTILSTFVYGLSDISYTALGTLSPVYHVLAKLGRSPVRAFVDGEEIVVGYVFENWGYLGAIAAAGVVMAAAAFFLFRRRHLESAGDMIAVRPLRPVFKYCVTTGCALVLGVLIAAVFFSNGDPSLPVLAACMVCGGFVGYFTCEILLKKSFRVFRREWIGFGAFTACLLAVLLLIEFDVFGYERRVPELDQIESVSLQGYGNRGRAVITDEALIADIVTLHQSVINEKSEQEVLKKEQEYMDPASPIDSSYLYLVYQLKDGETLVREYRIYCDEALWRDAGSLPRQYESIINDPEIVALAHTPTYEVSPASVNYSTLSYYNAELDIWEEVALTSEQGYELYTTCVLPDIRSGAMGRVYPFVFEDSVTDAYMADFNIEVQHAADTHIPRGERVVLDYA